MPVYQILCKIFEWVKFSHIFIVVFNLKLIETDIFGVYFANALKSPFLAQGQNSVHSYSLNLMLWGSDLKTMMFFMCHIIAHSMLLKL